ncbi:type II toxin-antitoxin system VapC family toxin [Mobiluncus holmesii]|uniref:Ribonuclease VapC n=1 Tax=Mobiluncus porci TaxID=2652278 RepID=A0A7K0K3W6_9ACTO|nr:type II toxin-antitoxin system VapC family toxin [Mobiluncus porci]
MLDTSVFIASESGRALNVERLPEEIFVSAITYSELYAGVLAALDVDTRARRMGTLQVLADVELLPVNRRVAELWAELRVKLRESRRRINVNDLWIAATALANNLPLFTQDADFSPIAEVSTLKVIEV